MFKVQSHAQRTNRARILTAAAALALFTYAPSAPAANITTTWNGATDDWFNAAQWNQGIPLNTATDLFRPLINAGTVTLSANTTISGMSLASGTTLIVASNNTLTDLVSFAGNSSLAGIVNLQSSSFLDVYDNIILTNASISGDGTYRQLARTLTLLGANSGTSYFSNFVIDGSASIFAGNLVITHHADFGTFGTISAKISLTSGASLNFNFTGSSQTLGTSTFDLAGNTTLNHGRLAGGFVTNSGTLTLTGAPSNIPTYAPATLVNTGTINLTSAILDLTTANSVNLGGQITLDAASSINSKNNVTLNNAGITGAGVFQQFAGTLSLLGVSAVENFALNASATLVGNTLTITGHADFASTNISNQRIVLNSGASLNFLAAPNPLTGTYTLNGVTTFSGVTNYAALAANLTNNGTLNISGATLGLNAPSSFSSTGAINVQSGMLDLIAVGACTLSGDISLGATGILRPGTNAIFNNASIHGLSVVSTPSVTFHFAGETFVQNAVFGSIANSLANSTLHFTGQVSLVGGGITGNYQVDPSALATLTGTNNIGPGTLTNNGTLTAGTDLLGNITASSLNFSGTIINNNFMRLAATLLGTGTLTNNGVLENISASNVTFPSSVVLLNSGTLTGGFILSAGTSSGMLTPDAGPSPHTLTLSTNIGPFFSLTNGAVLTSANGGRILAQGTLFVSGNVTADHLTLGAIAGAGTLTLLGTNNSWNGGVSTGNILIPTDSSLAIAGASPTLSGTLTNNGNFFVGFVPPFTLNGLVLNFNSPGSLINNGTLTLEASISGPGTLTNHGLMTNSPISSGTARSLFGFVVNTGTITGSFNITSGSSSGVLSPDLDASPRTLTLSNNFSLSNGALLTSAANGRILSTGTLTVSGNVTADHLTLNALNGTGTLTLNGTSNLWSTGPMSAGILRIPADSALSTFSGIPSITGGTLVNSGLLYVGFVPPNQLTNAGLSVVSPGGLINNGTISIEAALQGSGTLTNNGLINVAATTSFSTRTLGVALVNNGTVNGIFALGGAVFNNGLISGTATLSAGPVFNTGTISGAITIASAGSSSGMLSGDSPQGPRALNINNAFTLTNGAQVLSTTGTVTTSGALFILGNVSASHFSFHSLNGSGTLNLTGPDTWVQDFSAIPLLHILPSGTLTLSDFSAPNLTLTSGTLLNEGLLQGSTVSSPTLILQGGTLDNRGTFTLPRGGLTGNAPLVNSGLIQLPSAISNSLAVLKNTGTISANGGTLTIANAGTFSGLLLAPTAASQIIFGNIGTPRLQDATLSGPGAFSGNVSLSGLNTVSNTNFANISGTGTLTVTGNYSFTPSLTLNAATLISQNSGSNLSQSVQFNNSASFYNTGTLTASSSTFNMGAPATGGGFYNAGLMTIANGTVADNNVPFYNTGTLVLTNTGHLTINGPGIISGVVSVASISTLIFNPTNGNTMILKDVTFLGDGGFTGPVNFQGVNHFKDTTIYGAGNGGAGSLTTSGLLSLSGFTTINNGFTEIVLPAGTLGLGLSSPNGPATIDSATLINYGQSTFGFSVFGSLIKLAHGGQFQNAGTLSYANNGASFSFDADGDTRNAFINTGLMSFASDSGSIGITAPFYNTGTLTVSNRTNFGFLQFTLSGGGSASGLLSATSLLGAGISAPYTFDNATISGFGASALLTLRDTVTAVGLGVSAGLVGPGTLAGGGISWIGGTLANTGGILINGSAQSAFYASSVNPPPLFANAVIRFSFNPADKILDGSSLTVAPGESIAWGFGNSPPPLPAPDAISLKNGATILNNGSFYTYVGQPSFNSADNHTANAFINTGVFGRSSLTISNFFNTTTFHIPFHNSGLVDIQQGRIDFAAGYFDDNPITGNTAKFKFAPNTGLYFSGGTYDFGDAPFDLGPGGLYGTGTVHGHFTASGIISPGNSPGNLTISGDLALASASTLNIEISYAGTTPQFDTLTVLGNFTAAGTLNLTLLGAPPADLSTLPFNFLHAGHFTGAFLNAPEGARLTDATGQLSFLLSYSPDGPTLSDPQLAPEPASLLLLTPALLHLLRRRLKRRHP